MKRKEKKIVLGSGKFYLSEFNGVMPTTNEIITDICVEANRYGDIKSGATVTYTAESYTESDDLGLVVKIITTTESATLKLGLITWNGSTLNKLIDRSSISEEGNYRVTKIGGAGNAQGKNYVAVFYHHDAVDGDMYVAIVGTNTAGATITFAKDAGSLIEPEFTAQPHDEDGTLIKLIEDIGTSTDTPMLGVASAPGSTTGKTAISVAPAKTSTHTYVYKTGATSIVVPAVDTVLSDWTAWNGTDEITLENGKYICIAEVDTSTKCKKAGGTFVISKV